MSVFKRILLFCALFVALNAMPLKTACLLEYGTMWLVAAWCFSILRERGALTRRFIEFLLDSVKAVYHRDSLSGSRHRLLTF